METKESKEQYNPHTALRLLKQAMAEGMYFHGSKTANLTELSPKHAFDHSQKHGEYRKVVYAAPDDFLLPLTLSLAQPIDPKKQMGLRISGKQGEPPRIWSDTNNLRFDGTASIYVLSPEKFTAGDFDYEVYAKETVSPELEIVVTPDIIKILVEEGDIICDISLD